MGRQIRFFFTEKDEEDFLQAIFEHGDFIIDSKGRQMTKHEIFKENPAKIYIKPTQAVVIMRESGYVEAFESNIIDYRRSRIQSNDPKKFQVGRLWIELIGYASNGSTFRKDKWIEDEYNYYKKWILKHCKISKNKDYYIGSTAYLLYKDKQYEMLDLDYLVEFN
jgi:hypothetical protein